MSKAVVLASLTFPTKKAAKDFYRSIRDRYQDGEQLTSEDDGYLRDLIVIHPEAGTKFGSGIRHFTVETDSKFGTTRHFVIHRLDGSSTDVSFISAIDGRNERKDRFEALRRAIEGQIIEFKTSILESGRIITCPLRDVPITKESYHVDHEPPLTFVILATRWLDLEKLTLSEVRITPPEDNQIVTEMIDCDQLRSWQDFHRAHAKLRLLSPLGNLSDAKLS